MAGRIIAIDGMRLAGGVAAALVILLCLGSLLALSLRAGGLGTLSAADWSAIRFTISQAVVSALISVLGAIPVARALARRRFKGRGLLITLLGAPFLLPVIVAIFGLLAIFGRNGLISVLLAQFGLPPINIYGFHGVVIAHVFFNLPLATRLILQGWLAIPSEHFRLVGSLGLNNREVFQVLERPMLRGIVPGALAVIFLICLSSFAVALILGGGPGATTIELAIYQALRFDFDLSKAATLGIVQVFLCVVTMALAWRWAHAPVTSGGLDRPLSRWDGQDHLTRCLDVGFLSLAVLFLLLPLGAVVWRGLPEITGLPIEVWRAAARSVVIALVSAGLSIVLALAMASRAGRIVNWAGALPLATSSLVLGTGLFLILLPFVNPTTLVLPITALVNALLSLPFIMRSLAPAVAEAQASQGRLADALGLQGWARWRWVLLPRIRRPLGFGAGLAAALSMGDLGVVALFSNGSSATLPLEMYRLRGAYQTDQAEGAALLLLAFSLLLFWMFDRGGRANAAN